MKLTLDCSDHTVAIFDQLLQKLVRPFQLQLVTLEGLPEVRTVAVALAELERRVTHLLLSRFRSSQQDEPGF